MQDQNPGLLQWTTAPTCYM